MRENNNNLSEEETVKNKCLGLANNGERIMPKILQGRAMFRVLKGKMQKMFSPLFYIWVNMLHRSMGQVNINCAIGIYPASNLTSDSPQQWYSITNVVFKEGWTNFLSHWAQTKPSKSVNTISFSTALSPLLPWDVFIGANARKIPSVHLCSLFRVTKSIFPCFVQLMFSSVAF